MCCIAMHLRVRLGALDVQAQSLQLSLRALHLMHFFACHHVVASWELECLVTLGRVILGRLGSL